jgi:hypothetical protein
MALEIKYNKKKTIYEDCELDPAAAVQYDGGGNSSDVSMVLSSFSG